MASKVRRIGIVAVLGAIFLIGAMQLVFSFSYVGVTRDIGNGGIPLTAEDLSDIPQSVVEDAERLAAELFGDYQDNYDDFASQLLGLYSQAEGKDFIILFNPGGWGRDFVGRSSGWWSIFAGIESELDSSGYTSVVLNYQRTVNTLRGNLNEVGEMLTGYSSKARNLASRIEFVTAHNPDLKVIIAGESNGTIICDRTISILSDNTQVYSIHTGPPVWYNSLALDRTLIITDNGIVPDSFSQGDLLTMFGANLKALFRLPQAEGDYGTIAYYIRAPGHDYWWQYPGVRSQIEGFLEINFKR